MGCVISTRVWFYFFFLDDVLLLCTQLQYPCNITSKTLSVKPVLEPGILIFCSWFLHEQIDSGEFSCERNITAAPASSGSGTEVTIDITYEPMHLGESRGVLSVVSPIGGEYSFPLQGHCTPPKPQGPFVVRNKSAVSIPFKNVFPATTVFSFQVCTMFFWMCFIEL